MMCAVQAVCFALLCTALHCFALLCTALHCFALLCTALHCLDWSPCADGPAAGGRRDQQRSGAPLGVSRPKVSLGRKRYADHGIASDLDFVVDALDQVRAEGVATESENVALMNDISRDHRVFCCAIEAD